MADKLIELTEGKTKLLVPEQSLKFRGPGKRIPAFYNPLMEFNRDISVIVLKALKKKKVLDGLAGTGARGIRLANEVGGEIIINDLNKVAFELIKLNIRLNKLENAKAENKDLRVLLAENSYDYIDIDPFGSPMPFLDSAFRAAKKSSLLGITATDLVLLCGAHRKACSRRYFSLPLRAAYAKELGLRILIGACAREALKYDRAITPILAYYADHYFRVYLLIDKGARKASTTLKNIGWVAHNFETQVRKILTQPRAAENYIFAGPCWVGKLFDSRFLEKLTIPTWLRTELRIKKFLALWKEESKAPALYHETNALAKLFTCAPPKLEKIISLLHERNFIATRTHFSPTGFKTNASVRELKSVFRCKV